MYEQGQVIAMQAEKEMRRGLGLEREYDNSNRCVTAKKRKARVINDDDEQGGSKSIDDDEQGGSKSIASEI